MSRKARRRPKREARELKLDPDNLRCSYCEQKINGVDPVRWRPGVYLMHVICYYNAREEGLVP